MKTALINILKSLSILLALAILLLNVGMHRGSNTVLERLEQKQAYRFFEKEIKPGGRICSIAEDSGVLYVFYDYAGVVNVYQIDGTFMYAIQVSAIQNGAGTVAILDHKLYVISTEHVIYCFDGKALQSTLVWDYQKWQNGDHSYNDLEQQIEAAEQDVTESGFTIAANGYGLEQIDANGNINTVSFLPTEFSFLTPANNILVILIALLNVFIFILSRKRPTNTNRE